MALLESFGETIMTLSELFEGKTIILSESLGKTP